MANQILRQHEKFFLGEETKDIAVETFHLFLGRSFGRGSLCKPWFGNGHIMGIAGGLYINQTQFVFHERAHCPYSTGCEVELMVCAGRRAEDLPD